MYPPGEVAKLLDVPAPTVRRWSARFARFLSPSAQGAGRKRKYTEQDLSVLARVRDLASKNFPLDDIVTQLADVVVDIPPATDHREQITALALPGVLKEFNRISAQLARMEEQRQQDQEQITALQRRVDELAARLEQERRPLLEKIRDRFKRPPTVSE